MMEKRVRLFRNGSNQAIRIPREWELPGDEAILRQEGDHLIIEPAEPQSLLAILDALEPLNEDIGEITDFPPEPVNL